MKAQNIPLFIILPGIHNSTRRVRLGWIVDFDDLAKWFLIEYGDDQPVQNKIEEEICKKDGVVSACIAGSCFVFQGKHNSVLINYNI